MYESRAYDDEYGQPVVVLVATGTHDVSRLVNTLMGRCPVVEQMQTGEKILRQVKNHNGGLEALKLLARHGGTDFLREDDCAPWHILHAEADDTFVTGQQMTVYRLEHPEACRLLPPGAVCWAEYDGQRESWPDPVGVYRIRPAETVPPPGPDEYPAPQLEIQLLNDEQAAWIDWEEQA